MKLNKTTKDALKWCLLLETSVYNNIDDIDQLIGQGIWHIFTFETKKDLVNAARAYRILYKKSKEKYIFDNNIKENIIISAQKVKNEYIKIDFEKIYALALHPFDSEYETYKDFFKFDITKDEYVAISYGDTKPLEIVIKGLDCNSSNRTTSTGTSPLAKNHKAALVDTLINIVALCIFTSS
jgi:hypothetical protein